VATSQIDGKTSPKPILFSFLACTQILLNLYVDHLHFDYITNDQKYRRTYYSILMRICAAVSWTGKIYPLSSNPAPLFRTPQHMLESRGTYARESTQAESSGTSLVT
jgi:hypothetical protein